MFCRKLAHQQLTYTWFIPKKKMNRLMHALHGNTSSCTKEEIQQFVNRLKVQDVPDLIDALKQSVDLKGKRKKWSDRKKDTGDMKRWKACTNKFISLVSYNDSPALLTTSGGSINWDPG